MASFQQRKNGSITVKVRRHGVEISETFSKREDAEAWARRKESEIERGLWRDTSEADSTTIADLIDKYRKEVMPKLAGKGTGSALNIIEIKLGKYTVSKLTSKIVAGYRDQRLLAVSAESVRKEMGTLSKMIDISMKEWGIGLLANPCKIVSKPPPGKGRDRRLHKDEESRLFAALGQCRSPYMLPLVKFALETAGRQGELLSLRRRDVDKQRKFCMFYDTKNGENRAAPLTSAAMAILEALPSDIKDDRVFPISQSLVVQAWGHAVTRARRMYEKELINAGKREDEIAADTLLTNLHFHDLRHEALSRLAERGDLSVIELASISGHKTLQMLKRYTHLQAEKLAEKLG